MKPYYPMMVDLQNRACIVIGGGEVAKRKIASLLQANAAVTMLSPQAVPELEKLVEERKITWKKRVYTEGDLQGYFLVVVATDNRQVNEMIYQDVNHQIQLVNVVDSPELCSFIVPASFNRGHLQIAVATFGASPGLSRSIKKQLEHQFGEEYARYTDFLAEMRSWIFQQNVEPKLRRQLFDLLVTEDYQQRAMDGEVEAIKQEIVRMISNSSPKIQVKNT